MAEEGLEEDQNYRTGVRGQGSAKSISGFSALAEGNRWVDIYFLNGKPASMRPDTACGAENCANSPSSHLVPARVYAD